MVLSTVVIWTAAFAVLAVVGRRTWRDVQTTDISGLVLTHEKRPVSHAIVTLLRGHSVVRVQPTTDDGRFSFGAVQMSASPEQSLQVAWRGAVVSVPLSRQLAKDGLPPILFPESASQSPIRELYFDLSGITIDYLLKGSFDKAWANSMGGQPWIWRNALFNFLEREAQRYSYRFDFDNLYTKPPEAQQDDPALRQLAHNSNAQMFFAGSLTNPLDGEANPADVASLKKGGPGWFLRIEADEQPAQGPVAPTLWRFATRNDLSTFRRVNPQVVAFWESLTTSTFPSQFAPLQLYYSSCGSSWRSTLFLPSLSLRVLVVQNISNANIRLTDVTSRNVAATPMRSVGSDDEALSRAPSKQEAPFAGQDLRPGEQVVIPQRLFVKTSPEEAKLAAASVEDGIRWVNSLQGIGFYDDEPPVLLLPKSTLTNYALRQVEPLTSPDLVLGPSKVIEGVRVDGNQYTVRQRDEAKLFLRGGYEGGSCPSVYTRAVASDSWRSEGMVLTGINSKSKEREVVRELDRFDGSLLLVEREPEISHIDAMWIVVSGRDGTQSVLRPADPRLQQEDRSEVTLRQGEKLHVVFQQATPLLREQHITLHTVGYYTPLSSSSAASYR